MEECLRRAAAEREKRESSIRLAGQHFRLAGGKSNAGSVAGTYALRARESADNAREWELKAARLMIQNQLARSGHTIDLHHLTVNEAKTVALEAVEKWWEGQKASFGGFAAGATEKQRTPLPSSGMTIVTGVGKHSAGKTGVLGPAVANALEESGWRVQRGENGRGYLVVKGRR